MNVGIHHSISNDDYHAGPGVSKSDLDKIEKSPAHYYAAKLDPSRPSQKEQTASQLTGTLLHCALLEPDQFILRYAVGPGVNRNAKTWKDFEASLAAGVTAIKPDDYTMAWAQADSMRRLPQVRELLGAGQAEASAYWSDPETGVLCRCRPDWHHPCGDTGVILMDAKTCGSASPTEFVREAARHRYDVQDAYYSDGFAIASGREVLAFIFAAVECDYPYAAAAVMLDEHSKDAGRRKYRRNLNTYAECLRADTWPGYPQDISLVSLPAWALND